MINPKLIYANIIYLALLPLGSLFFVLTHFFFHKVNYEFMDATFANLVAQQEYKFILNKLDYSIIILKDDQIEFVNDRFIYQFERLINHYYE